MSENKPGTWDGWNAMKAEERLVEAEAAEEKMREIQAGIVGLEQVTIWNAFVIKERFFGTHGFCERCEEECAEVLMYQFDEDDPCVESAALDDLGIESQVCATCIADHKAPACENCGLPESYILRGYKQADSPCRRRLGDKIVEFTDGHNFQPFESRNVLKVVVE